MLSLEEFKDAIVIAANNQIKSYPSLDGYSLEMKSMSKVNTSSDFLSLKLSDNIEVSPIINIDEVYDIYLKSGNLSDTCSNLLDAFSRAKERSNDLFSGSKNNIDNYVSLQKDKIYFQLINTEFNQELLSKVPHRDFNGLSIIYRNYVGQQEGGFLSYIIYDEQIKSEGITEDELFNLAYENTQKLFPVKIKSMRDTFIEMITQDMEDVDEDYINMLVPEDAPDMYVISNETNLNGASSLIYEDKLLELSEKLDGDLIILPSSIHEAIAVKYEKDMPIDYFSEMVFQINQGVLDEDIRLSNQVYLFDRSKKKLECITDAPRNIGGDMKLNPGKAL